MERKKRKRKIRVLISKIGLDGHDRGVVNVAYALRDAGMEVVYLGRHLFPDEIAQIAVQEAVDIVGISSLADAHMTLVPSLVENLKKRGSDIPVILGGFIQPEDIPQLKEKGVAEIFGIGTRLDRITEYIEEKMSFC
jgi:methylmalonyl-CoA mutase C-terminal domain/subunit